MVQSRGQVFLGFLAGGLLLNEAVLLTLVGGAFVLAHHMFIVSGSCLAHVLFGLLALAPIVLGIDLARRAFSERLRPSRSVVGFSTVAFLIVSVAPLVTIAMLIMGSLGMDIHRR